VTTAPPAPFRFDVARLARLAWAHRRALLLVNGAVAVLAVAAVLVMPCWYRSSVTLVPAPGDGAMPDFTGGAALLTGHGFSLDSGPSPQDELKMVGSSRAVADSVIRRLDLVRAWNVNGLERTRDRLAEHTDITTPKQGQVIVTAEARTPRLARDLAVAYTEYAASESRRLKQSLAPQRRQYLEARLAELEKENVLAGGAVQRFEQSNRMVAMPEQARETMDAAGLMQAQAAAIRTEMAAARRYFTDQSPEVTVLHDRLGELERQLTAIQKSGGTLFVKTDDLPALKQQYLKLTREQQSLVAVSELLRRVYEQARVEEANPVPTFSVLDAPEVPERRARPQRAVTVALATLLSCAATLGLLYLRGSLDVLTSFGRRRPAPQLVPADGRRDAA